MKQRFANTVLIILVVACFVFFIFTQNLKNSRQDKVTNILPIPTSTKSIPIKPITTREFVPTKITIPIIAYHYIEVVTDEKDFIRKSLAIYPSTFEKQILTLRSKGYEPVFAKDIPEIINGIQKPEKKPVVITVDDGYKDFYTDALPVIIRQKVKVTIYVVPGYIGWLNYMNKEDIQKALDSGFVEIGAHTVHHTSLTNVSVKNASYEITESKNMLEKMFNTKVLSFAYPYGRSNLSIQKMVKDTGYTNAVSEIFGTTQGPDNLFYMSRIRVGYFNSVFK